MRTEVAVAEPRYLKILLTTDVRERLRQAAHLMEVHVQALVVDALVERLRTIADLPVPASPPPPADHRSTLITQIDPELRAQVRTAAYLRGVTEREFVADAINTKLASIDFDTLIRRHEQALRELQDSARRRWPTGAPGAAPANRGADDG